jgi:hypothetical protein
MPRGVLKYFGIDTDDNATVMQLEQQNYIQLLHSEDKQASMTKIIMLTL